MGSDESVTAMMPIKYPFLFPTTIGVYPDKLYNKMHYHMNSNRKPEHTRLFRAGFDGQGHILRIENKVFTKYVVASKENALEKVKEPNES